MRLLEAARVYMSDFRTYWQTGGIQSGLFLSLQSSHYVPMTSSRLPIGGLFLSYLG
jgi:hypothetical protein